MRLRDTLRLLGGSTAIYVVMAACSAAGGGFTPPDAGLDATGPSGTHDAAARSDGRSPHDARTAHDARGRDSSPHDATGKDALIDALMHPVPEASADLNQSGSRLKTQRYVGLDGSSVFVGMYDTQLTTPCVFTGGLSDGSTRCIPSAAGVTTGVFFADAMCSVPVVAVSGCGAQPVSVTVVAPATSCSAPSTTQVFSVTGPWTGLVYVGDAVTCAAAPMTTTSAYSFYSLATTEVPPSTFVAGTLTIDF